MARGASSKIVGSALALLAVGCASAPAPVAAPCAPPVPAPAPPVAASCPPAAAPAPLAPPQPQPAAEEPARAVRAGDVAAFNAWLDSLAEPESLVLVVARAFGDAEARNITLAVAHGSSEAPVSAVVTVTLDGLLDDSVRGEEHVLRFERTGTERFRLTSSQRRVRCWPRRGHAEFSNAPCL